MPTSPGPRLAPLRALFRCAVLVLAATCAAGLAAPAGASVAVAFPLPQPVFGDAFGLIPGTDGFEFIPNTSITVTALGWYDQGGDGLRHDHPMGIFLTSTQTLVAPAVTVTTASTLDPVSNFRYQSVTPFVLSAGLSYTVAGYSEGPNFDEYVVPAVGDITFGPGIDFVRYRAVISGDLQFPVLQGGLGDRTMFLGSNFQYTIPAPSAAVLLGVSGLVCARRRR